jgi:hypothetical protein
MFSKNPLNKFPFWQYLNQPLLNVHYQPVLNPRRFWYLYSITLLERCLDMDCAPKDHQRD